jgi:hypothetical protein
LSGRGEFPALPLALIHRSAWNKNSRKFAKKVSKIAQLSDALTLIEEYAATATHVEVQVRYLPSF